MPNPKPTRADDERLLSMIEARRKGLSLAEAGQMFCVTGRAVAAATNRIRSADLAESGEPVESVRATYWG